MPTPESAAAAAPSAATHVGHRFAAERRVAVDARTGVDLIVLTDGRAADERIYPTHRQWTADGAWVVFHSAGRAPGRQVYAVHERDGDIVQLTEGAGTIVGSLCVAKESMTLYFLRDAIAARRGLPDLPTVDADAATPVEVQIVELRLADLFADALAGAPKPAAAYERVCATLPPGTRDANGQALDADERTLYVSIAGGDVGQHLPPGTAVWVKPDGMRMGTGPGGLRKIDLATGAIGVVLDTPFQIGHVQTNPWVPGEIVYCHETGGDADQRMWTTRADGSGNRPLFVEQPLDWATHEVVVTRDEVMFNLIGHQARLRVRPTGIAVINLRTNAVQLLGQIDEREEATPDDLPSQNAAGPGGYGGFWHSNGSADGRWAAGDTFGGDVYLIDRRDGRRRLLTSDHRMKPDHAHPTFSDDGTRVLIQSGHFTDGKHLQLIVVPIPTAWVES